MRIAKALASTLLMLSVPVFGQTQVRSPAAQWGAEQQTFDVRFGVRGVEATFTVAQNGFGWQRLFTNSEATFSPWTAITAWCWGPSKLLVRTEQRPSDFAVHDVEDLATIVDAYFKKYAPNSEWSAPNWECTRAGLSRPHPAELAKVRELLEAAAKKR